MVLTGAPAAGQALYAGSVVIIGSGDMASALTHGEAFAGIPIFIGTASADQKSGV